MNTGQQKSHRQGGAIVPPCLFQVDSQRVSEDSLFNKEGKMKRVKCNALATHFCLFIICSICNWGNICFWLHLKDTNKQINMSNSFMYIFYYIIKIIIQITVPMIINLNNISKLLLLVTKTSSWKITRRDSSDVIIIRVIMVTWKIHISHCIKFWFL